ncbi:hypothetical protein Q1695_006312 [Nippostrongylus brasiliensis]|nr:hypothetical protein Q1695_006312 [Nippostrongylus brasiliensis]
MVITLEKREILEFFNRALDSDCPKCRSKGFRFCCDAVLTCAALAVDYDMRHKIRRRYYRDGSRHDNVRTVPVVGTVAPALSCVVALETMKEGCAPIELARDQIIGVFIFVNGGGQARRRNRKSDVLCVTRPGLIHHPLTLRTSLIPRS